MLGQGLFGGVSERVIATLDRTGLTDIFRTITDEYLG